MIVSYQHLTFHSQKSVPASKYLKISFSKAVSLPRGNLGRACEPGFLTSAPSVHHGPRVAQPIHLDSSQLSKKFISDYLWSLVDVEW